MITEEKTPKIVYILFAIIILGAGYFLGKSNWTISKFSFGGVEISPPTVTPLPILPTSTTIPAIPATVVIVPQQSTVQLAETQKTGEATRKVYNVTLQEDEVIVGDALDFQNKGYSCVVFMIRGAGSFEFSVLDGAWYRYAGVTTDSAAEELLQGRVQYLQNHWFCKNVAFPVERIE